MLLVVYLIVTVLILGFVVFNIVEDVWHNGMRYIMGLDVLAGLGFVITFIIGAYLLFTNLHVFHLSINFSVNL